MNLRVAVAGKVECDDAPSRSESEPEEGVWGDPKRTVGAFESAEADAKPSDLHLARVKSR